MKLFRAIYFLVRVSLILLLGLAHPDLAAQSKMATKSFLLLPPDKVYGLSVVTRDSLLKGKTYYPQDNDSNSVQAYNYGFSILVNDYQYVSMSYETEQRATGLTEIRNFKTTKGETLVVVSAAAGIWQANYQQTDLSIFIFRNEKTIIPYKENIFPAADESLFLRPGIPDSVKKMIKSNSNLAFDFSGQNPILALNSIYLSNNPISKKWLKGDVIEFAWTGSRFHILRTGW
jgi:hypothetical protein